MIETLTHEEVYRALTSTENNHSLINLVRDEKEYLATVTREARDDPEKDKNTRRKLRGFADRVESLGKFTLEPIDIIRIWKELETYHAVGDRSGEALSAIVSVAYAIAPLGNKWRGTTKGILEMSFKYDFPLGTIDQKEEGEIFNSRLDEVLDSVDSIMKYAADGLEEDKSDLAKRVKTIALEGHTVFTTDSGKEQDSTLGLIGHYFRNSLIPLSLIRDKYKALHR